MLSVLFTRKPSPQGAHVRFMNESIVGSSQEVQFLGERSQDKQLASHR
jgi:hypothetical protein